MPDRGNIFDLTHDDLVIACRELGQKAYRARQLLNWLYINRVTSFSEMTNIPVKLQETMSEAFTFEFPAIGKKLESRDGSVKYLFELADGERIETVLIRSDVRLTLCLSSQVGCKFGCTFCRTAAIGFVRNLTPGEITGQLLVIESETGEKIDNIVFMGMGEPFDNFENLLKAINIFTHPEALARSPRRITVSTAGLPDEMIKLRRAFPNVGLSVSLNAPNSELRETLMPIEGKHPINELVETIGKMRPDPQNPVTIEYVLLKEINDSISNAEMLARLLKDTKHVKVNLIRYNSVGDDEFDAPDEKDVLGFQNVIRAAGIDCFIRKSAGPDISAACGQLAADYPGGG